MILQENVTRLVSMLPGSALDFYQERRNGTMVLSILLAVVGFDRDADAIDRRVLLVEFQTKGRKSSVVETVIEFIEGSNLFSHGHVANLNQAIL